MGAMKPPFFIYDSLDFTVSFSVIASAAVRISLCRR